MAQFAYNITTNVFFVMSTHSDLLDKLISNGVNPQVCVEFVPEEPAMSKRGTSLEQDLIPLFGQTKGMCESYLSVVTDFLPRLNQGEPVTKESLAALMDKTHQSQCTALADGMGYQKKGYRQNNLIRWTISGEMGQLLARYLSKDPNLLNYLKSMPEDSMRDNFSTLIEAHFGVKKAESKALLRLLEKAKKLKPKLMPSQRSEALNQPVLKPIYQLQSLYHERRLTKREIRAMKSWFTLPLMPELLPEHMEQVLSDLANQWQALKAEESVTLEEVCALSEQAYFNLSGSQAYWNCNGRLATVVMNTVLMSFGYPPALLRNVAEVNFDPQIDFRKD